eukprot:m.200897 g.200897  ORF g.200897 m.200897 type:complete len:58 (-) comp17700_c0_seq6:988-1161(-)
MLHEDLLGDLRLAGRHGGGQGSAGNVVCWLQLSILQLALKEIERDEKEPRINSNAAL